MAGVLSAADQDGKAVTAILLDPALTPDRALLLGRLGGAIGGFCPPADGTIEAAVRLACAYLASHPASRNGPADAPVRQSFREAWPCRR